MKVVQVNNWLVHILHCSPDGRHFKVTLILMYMSKYIRSKSINRSVDSHKSVKGLSLVINRHIYSENKM